VKEISKGIVANEDIGKMSYITDSD